MNLFGVQALIGASIILYIVVRDWKKHAQYRVQHKGHRHTPHSHDEGHGNISAQIDSFAYNNNLAQASPTTKIFFRGFHADSKCVVSFTGCPSNNFADYCVFDSCSCKDSCAVLLGPFNLPT